MESLAKDGKKKNLPPACLSLRLQSCVRAALKRARTLLTLWRTSKEKLFIEAFHRFDLKMKSPAVSSFFFVCQPGSFSSSALNFPNPVSDVSSRHRSSYFCTSFKGDTEAKLSIFPL